MAKFKVLKQFRDIHTKAVHEKGDEIEMTVKRSDEVAKNLDDSYLERLDPPDSKDDESKTDEPKVDDDKPKEADK